MSNQIQVPVEFIRAVEKMMEYQRVYYGTGGRTQTNLVRAKEQEKEVRTWLNEIREHQGREAQEIEQMTLFTGEEQA